VLHDAGCFAVAFDLRALLSNLPSGLGDAQRSRFQMGALDRADRYLQHQQCQSPPSQSSAVARDLGSRGHLSASVEMRAGRFPADAIRKAGYHAVWRRERSWNGVAILARKREPVLICETLPGDSGDKNSRYIEAAVDGVAIALLYLPNGNPQPGPKFKYKLAWFDRLIDHANELLAQDVPAVLAGDYNVVPTDFDIYAICCDGDV
jgi:hypothetical protein